MRRLLPPRPFLDAIAIRVALLWLFLRGATGLGSAGSGDPFPESLAGPPITAPFLVSAIVLVLWVEMRRRSELVFLANLGHSFGRIAVFVAAECFAFEVALRLAVV